jgi:hypothetical protein
LDNKASDHDLIYVTFSLKLPDQRWVRCLFLDLLNRDPGSDSGGYYLDLLNKGTSKEVVVDSILKSPEHCTMVTALLPN